MRDPKKTESFVVDKFKQAGFSDRQISHILEAYKQPWREYHTLEHLECMLAHVADHEQKLIVAIALHDIQYRDRPVAAGINEHYSALLVKYFFPNCHYAADEEFIQTVENAIIATSFYTVDQNPKLLSDTALCLCDLDLCNFALPYEEMEYWSDIAIQEHKILYKAIGVDINDEAAVRGQIVFLRSIVNRTNIYYKKIAWEMPARQNIIRRMQKLHMLIADSYLAEQGGVVLDTLAKPEH